jgi:hypothetical protein
MILVTLTDIWSHCIQRATAQAILHRATLTLLNRRHSSFAGLQSHSVTRRARALTAMQ